MLVGVDLDSSVFIFWQTSGEPIRTPQCNLSGCPTPSPPECLLVMCSGVTKERLVPFRGRRQKGGGSYSNWRCSTVGAGAVALYRLCCWIEVDKAAQVVVHVNKAKQCKQRNQYSTPIVPS